MAGDHPDLNLNLPVRLPQQWLSTNSRVAAKGPLIFPGHKATSPTWVPNPPHSCQAPIA